MAALPTISSTTLEAGLLEIIEAAADKQADTVANPDGVQMITAYSRDGNTGEINVALTIPSTSSEDADGRPVIFATQVFG